MPAYLESIIAAHRAESDADGRDVGKVVEETREQAIGSGPGRSFEGAVTSAATRRGMAVISEIKRRSPSRGALDPDLDPVSMAVDYEAGGAACLSVLTDRRFFGGDPSDLRSARAACSLPVLRKDFTVSLLDVCDALTMGADAVLLIATVLSDIELSSSLELCRQLSLAALVEVHDSIDLRRAVDAGAGIIGVNQRDLRTFEVDDHMALELGPAIPSGVIAVAESGIRSAGDVATLAQAGYQAVLVGETLVRAADRRAAVAELLGAGP